MKAKEIDRLSTGDYIKCTCANCKGRVFRVHFVYGTTAHVDSGTVRLEDSCIVPASPEDVILQSLKDIRSNE